MVVFPDARNPISAMCMARTNEAILRTAWEVAHCLVKSVPCSTHREGAADPPLAIEDLASTLRAHSGPETHLAGFLDPADTSWVMHLAGALG